MDAESIMTLLRESLVLILVFVALLAYAMVRGKRALMSLILGLYLALLISLKFPYYDAILGNSSSPKTESILSILIFAVFTAIGAFLFERLLSRDYEETAFEGIGKKALLASLGTILVLSYSYHVLPVSQFVEPGAPVSALFGPEQNFFWWLLVPLIGLFFI